jgi:hypothetical protein
MATERQDIDAGDDKVLVARDDAGPPPWELSYDDGGTPTIFHRHGEERVPASVTDRGEGVRVAECSTCEAKLELAGTPQEGGEEG